MLDYLPRPYPDELLYSVLARGRVHLGVVDQKVFMRMAFGDDKVTAVPDLPSHIDSLVANISYLQKAGPEQLIFKHTLFPLFAPFIPRERKMQLVDAMRGNHGESIHVRSGISAGKVKPPAWFRICPACLDDMKTTFGEYYWPRLWQVTGVELCPLHGYRLQDSSAAFRALHRHEFTPATPDTCPRLKREIYLLPGQESVADLVKQLLSLGDIPSPNYRQWSHFYHDLATQSGAGKGQHVRHSVLTTRFTRAWPTAFLKRFGLVGDKGELSWLESLFRKHRKSFSYLEHILAWIVFRPGESASVILDEANQEPPEKIHAVNQLESCSSQERERKRAAWMNLIGGKGWKGIKYHREHGYGGLYAWLYRHDRRWFMETNRERHLPRSNHSDTDWAARDRKLARILLGINRKSESISGTPRHSRNWFLLKLPHRASIEHHIDKLPLCKAFFERYTETIAEYQVRRITERLVSAKQPGLWRSRWELERVCGLNRKKLPELTDQFLSWIEVEIHANHF
ncbi:TnsD family Tn7-like transposition protein [Shewanella algae]|uniref:TnsD family Tn7-like transposition protein n=1 Tax=Shewanella algae TaxID=38313 RepID=UPI0031F535A4